ncbi:MAG: hypothetical protein ACOC1Z_04615 [Cyanobacteriota bacterium]
MFVLLVQPRFTDSTSAIGFIVIPIIFRNATVSVATREQDAPTLSLMVFIWNDYSLTHKLPFLKDFPVIL